MTSFVAIIETAGLAVGLALSERCKILQVELLFYLKPFKIGDFIEAQGYVGTVKRNHYFLNNAKYP
jgi:small conductance mechanosensitive channel